MLIPAEVLEDPASTVLLDHERLAREIGMPVSELRHGLLHAFFASTAGQPEGLDHGDHRL
jgi:hypothetical protein